MEVECNLHLIKYSLPEISKDAHNLIKKCDACSSGSANGRSLLRNHTVIDTMISLCYIYIQINFMQTNA
jgi:hypothetical protein